MSVADGNDTGDAALPTWSGLMAQAGSQSLGSVTIGVMWGDELHKLELPFDRWLRILSGEAWTISQRYWHEGEPFSASWCFDGRGGLTIGYEDGGIGWEGGLVGVDLLVGPQTDGVDLAKHARSLAASEQQPRHPQGT